MAYRLAADAVLLLHLAFILFVVLGGLLALYWRRMPWLHLPAVAWGVYVEAGNRACPLTDLENQCLGMAGQAGYEGGFVAHRLLGLIYPDGPIRAGMAGLSLLVAWVERGGVRLVVAA